MHDPRVPHVPAAKHILIYLKGTTKYGNFFLRQLDRMKQFWRLILV